MFRHSRSIVSANINNGIGKGVDDRGSKLSVKSNAILNSIMLILHALYADKASIISAQFSQHQRINTHTYIYVYKLYNNIYYVLYKLY